MTLTGTQGVSGPCRCELCLAVLELAASAERSLQQERAKRKIAVVQTTKRKRAA